MVLIKIESLSQKELEHIAVQEGVHDAASMSRDELIETLREIYEDESDDSQMGGEDNIQRKFVTWLTDYRGEGSELTSLPGVVDLPDIYNETSIHLLTKNATWLYCYWSIANFDREKFDALSDLITVGESHVRPYPLWTLPADSLKLHPYIGSYAARGIVLYRENNPREDWTVEALAEAGILKPEMAARLSGCLIEETF